MFRTLLTLALGLVTAGLAQDAPSICDASIPITLIAKSGYPGFQQLSPADLRVRVSKTELPAQLRTDRSARVVFVLDHSGSMQLQWRLALEVLAEMMRQTPPDLPVSLFVFDEQIYFAPTRDDIEQLFSKLPEPHGRSRLFDTMASASAKLTVNPGDLIVAITDGGDNKSKTSDSDTMKWLRRTGARLFVVLFASYNPATEEEINGPRQLRILTKDSGGALFRINYGARPQLPLMPSDLMLSLLTYNRAELKISASRQPQPLKVSWTGEQGRTWKLSAPSHVPSCATSTAP